MERESEEDVVDPSQRTTLMIPKSLFVVTSYRHFGYLFWTFLPCRLVTRPSSLFSHIIPEPQLFGAASPMDFAFAFLVDRLLPIINRLAVGIVSSRNLNRVPDVEKFWM